MRYIQESNISEYLNIFLHFTFQNRGRFSDGKRSDELDEAYGPSFNSAGLALDSNKFTLPEPQTFPGEKLKTAIRKPESNINPNLGIKSKITPHRDEVEKECQQGSDHEESIYSKNKDNAAFKSLYAGSDKKFQCSGGNEASEKYKESSLRTR